MKKFLIYFCFLLELLFTGSIAYANKFDLLEKDSLRPKLKRIVDWPDSKLIYHFNTNSMVLFKTELYYSTRNGIFILDTKNKKAIPIDGGLDLNVPNCKAFTKLVIHKNQLYASNLFTGIYRFNDKQKKWVALNKGLTDTSFFDLISCNGRLYAPSHDHGLFVFNDNNDTWTHIKGDKSVILKQCACIDSVLWIGNMANELFRLNPKTNELKRIIQFREADKYENQIIGVGVSGIEHVHDTIYVGCHVSGMFKSTDNGLTWSKKPIKFVVGVLYKWQNYVFLSDYWGYKDGLFILNTVTDEFQKIDLGLKDQKILAIQCINGIFYITNNEGIWEISSDDFVKYYLPSP